MKDEATWVINELPEHLRIKITPYEKQSLISQLATEMKAKAYENKEAIAVSMASYLISRLNGNNHEVAFKQASASFKATNQLKDLYLWLEKKLR